MRRDIWRCRGDQSVDEYQREEIGEEREEEIRRRPEELMRRRMMR